LHLAGEEFKQDKKIHSVKVIVKFIRKVIHFQTESISSIARMRKNMSSFGEEVFIEELLDLSPFGLWDGFRGLGLWIICVKFLVPF
jgi:hypothetical protein